MLVYLDSSIVARAYLPDEPGHEQAAALMYGTEHLVVTASWTVVEVTSALVRARTGRAGDAGALLALLAEDTGEAGPLTLLRVDSERLEIRATEIVREHALRSLDALHVAVAELAARPLVEPAERIAFASRDEAQQTAAVKRGFWPLDRAP
ncbi:MAG: type II toxin-antitoxin system VapC family toxin [Candidatus Dormibacteraeota bacterium]|nr:type II toxin-antitoxin system VapC family toxin [Candidatus Dormibacteraeota bacterium]